MTISTHPHSLGESLHALHAKWGWIVALGVVYVIAGVIALGNELLATFVSVAIIGAMMFVSGVFEIIGALQMKSWESFILWILLGILYAVAGVFVFEDPLLAASVFTLLIGAALVATGVLRIVIALRLPKMAPWIMAVISGVITLLLGAIILFQWPVSSLYVLGLFLGIDLLFMGFSWINIGMALRRRA
jgi:uncharacterized membrane protein HdeD (DUF308 family)